MISKIQRSWRQIRDDTVVWNFQAGLEATIRGARVSFRCPFAHISLVVSMLPRKSWWGDTKTDFVLGRGNPRYTTDLSTAQWDFPIAKSPDKLDLNHEFPKDVARRNFSICRLQRKLSNGELMQRKWLVYSAGKIGYFAFL